jgi:hypothetical protein
VHEKSWLEKQMFFKESLLPLRHGKVVIASASRTEDPGFESRKGVSFLGLNALQCCCQIFMLCHCLFLRKISV